MIVNKRCMGCMELYNEEYDICPHCGYIKGTPAEEAIHMEPGTLLHDRYIVGKVLGFGGFGVTYIGWDGRLEQKVAIKEYLPGEFSTRMPGQSTVTVFNGDKEEQFRDGMEKFVDEAKRLARFQNETGIVKIFDSFYENETAYIIMEYLDGETLTERLSREKTIPEDEAIDMLMPVMNSLQVVHNEGILHRDIAPDNIFLTKDGEVKLIDFGYGVVIVAFLYSNVYTNNCCFKGFEPFCACCADTATANNGYRFACKFPDSPVFLPQMVFLVFVKICHLFN